MEQGASQTEHALDQLVACFLAVASDCHHGVPFFGGEAAEALANVGLGVKSHLDGRRKSRIRRFDFVKMKETLFLLCVLDERTVGTRKCGSAYLKMR